MSEIDHRLLESARIAVEDCLGITRGENVTIITDEERLPIAKAIAEISVERQASPVIIFFTNSQILYYEDKIPSSVSQALKRVDVLVTLYEKAIGKKMFFVNMYTWLRENFPCRIAALPGITTDTFRESMKGDFHEMANIAEELIIVFLDSNRLHLTTESGTDLFFSFSSKKFPPESSTGIIKQIYSIGNLPGAEVYAVPLPQSVEGRLVIDGSIPGQIVTEPISLHIQKGKVINVEPHSNSCAEVLSSSFKMFGEKARIVGEFGIGLNNAISHLYGISLIDEKMLGTAHVGLGNNRFFGGPNRCGIHIDLVLKDPTIEVDGKDVMRKGKLTFDLSDFQKSIKDIAGNINPRSLVRKETNRVCLAKNDTFQIFWRGGAGDTHFTSLFDQETTKVATRLWEKLSVTGKTVEQLQKDTRINRYILEKTILLLEKEGLLTIS